MSVIGSNVLAGASGQAAGEYQIDRSLRFNDGDSAYLNRTPSAASNRKTWTWSAWVKRANLGSQQALFGAWTDNSNRTIVRFNSSDQFQFLYQNGGTFYGVTTTQVFRDVGAWLHLAIAMDTAASTNTDRVKVYVNGSQIPDGDLSSFSSGKYPPQNTEYQINSTTTHHIGARKESGSFTNTYLDAYLANIELVDGQALAPTDFGEYDDNNVWQPKAFSSSNAATETTYTTSSITSVVTKPLVVTAGTNSTVNFSSLADSDVITFFVIGNGGSGGDGHSGGGSGNKNNGGKSGGRNGIYYRQLTKAQYVAAYGTTSYTQALTNNFGGTELEAPKGDGADGTSGGDCFEGTADAGTTPSINFGTLNALYPAKVTFSSGTAGNGGSSGTGPGSLSCNFGAGGEGGDAGIVVTAPGHTLPSTPTASNGTDGSGGNSFDGQSGNGGVGFGSGGGGGNGGGNGGAAGTGGAGAAGINIVITGEVGTTLTFTNNTNLSQFSVGDLVGGKEVLSVDTANNKMVIDGGSYSTGGTVSKTVGGYGTNGFKLDFSDNTNTTTIAQDSSGKGNNWTANYLSVASGAGNDSLIDTPTNYDAASGNNGGNYCTLNPLAISPNITPTLSNGNLEIERTATSSEWTSCGSTFAVSSGKYYWEVNLPTINGTIARWGVADANDYEFNRNTSSTGLPWLGSGTGTSWSMDVGGNTYHNGSTVNSSYTSTVTTSDVIGVALDCDANTLTFYKNGTSLGVAHSNVTASKLVPAVGLHGGTHNKIVLNFGQRPFTHTPPTNHKSLCTQNLPDPTIEDGSTAFDVFAETGTGASKVFTTPGGFGPDLVWAKSRTNSYNHALYDAVRGATKRLVPNSTQAEDTQTQQVTAFSSTGFTYGTGNPNGSNEEGVFWAWEAGTSNTSISVGSVRAASTVSSGNAYSAAWAGYGTATWSNTDSWSGLSAVSGNAKGYFSGTENLSDGSVISVANGSFSAGANGSNGWVLRASTTVTIDFTVYPNITEIATTSSDSQTFANRTVVATNPTSGSSLIATGKCFWFSNASQMSVSCLGTVNDAPAVPSIASTVRANTSTGFSIVTGSGNSGTVGHGLNAKPDLVIVKQLNGAVAWAVAHSALGTMKDNIIYLNGTNANTNSSNFWGSTDFDSSVFPISSNICTSGATFVAYCFTSVNQYSSFGKYAANGSTDGPFIYTGFRPAWVMVKQTDSAGNWTILDNARNTFNASDELLFPNLSDNEATTTTNRVDLTSNGFKLRGAGGNTNASGGTYIYAAFAEHPFKAARAR